MLNKYRVHPSFLHLVMTKFKILLSFSLVLTILVSCDEKVNLSDVVILATPKKDTTLYAGEKMCYHMRLFTIHDYVDGLTVSSSDIERGNVVCLDTSFAAKSKDFEFDFIYTAPRINKEELDVELALVVRDNLGNTSKVMRNVKVRNRQLMIAEKNGIILYAHNADLPNSLLLSDVSQPFVASLAPDSLLADIWLNPDDNPSMITWTSKTGLKFVRHNDFNYTTATAESLQATYLASKRYDAVNEVAVNDIIIVGHDELVEGVFFVNNILSGNGFQGQCLQLSFKGVSTN